MFSHLTSQGWIFFSGEYFSGVNIFQGWIYFRGEYFSGVNIFQGWIFFTRLPQTAWCRPPPPKSREQGGPVRAQWGKQVGQLGPRTCYLVEREKMASMGRRYAPSNCKMERNSEKCRAATAQPPRIDRSQSEWILVLCIWWNKCLSRERKGRFTWWENEHRWKSLQIPQDIFSFTKLQPSYACIGCYD